MVTVPMGQEEDELVCIIMMQTESKTGRKYQQTRLRTLRTERSTFRSSGMSPEMHSMGRLKGDLRHALATAARAQAGEAVDLLDAVAWH